MRDISLKRLSAFLLDDIVRNGGGHRKLDQVLPKVRFARTGRGLHQAGWS